MFDCENGKTRFAANNWVNNPTFMSARAHSLKADKTLTDNSYFKLNLQKL